MIDFIYDSETGKVTVGESTTQHQQDLLVLRKGDHKFRPTRGVGIIEELGNDGSTEDLRNLIKSEFERDGMVVLKVNIENEEITTDAYYPD